MEKAKILERLIKEQGYSLKSFALKCDIPYTTLYGIMANGQKTALMEPTYADVEKLVARNGKKMSVEQKMRLIQLLSEIEFED